MIAIHLSTVAEVRGRIEPLIRAHWEEVAMYKGAVPLLPDWETYYAIEAAGKLVVVIAEDGNQLVGYNVYMLTPMPHYASTLLAQNDILYLIPEYRRGLLAAKLISLGEGEAQRRGAKVVSMHVKIDHDFSPLLKRLGYRETDILYTKPLEAAGSVSSHRYAEEEGSVSNRRYEEEEGSG